MESMASLEPMHLNAWSILHPWSIIHASFLYRFHINKGNRVVEMMTRFNEFLGNSETILWNGPMGVFESKAYENGTREMAIHLVSCVASGAKVIVGGGDTAAALEKFGLMKDMTHVSTGGGASLELLSGNALPALNALEK